MNARVALDCDVSDGFDAYKALGGWLDAAEAGEMSGDEMVHRLNGIIEQLDSVRAGVRRSLGW